MDQVYAMQDIQSMRALSIAYGLCQGIHLQTIFLRLLPEKKNLSFSCEWGALHALTPLALIGSTNLPPLEMTIDSCPKLDR